MSKKDQKSYALEVSLIALVIAAAFVVQQFLNSGKPPSMPESGQSGEMADTDQDDADGEGTKEPGDEGDGVSPQPKAVDEVPQKYNPALSDLGKTPDWSTLDVYQRSIKKEDFLRELRDVFTLRDEWKKWVTLKDDHVLIRTHVNEDTSDKGAETVVAKKPLRYWRERSEISNDLADFPLRGVKIVLDPGHIGGDYAEMEGRSLAYRETSPVQEGNLTLIVSELLKEQLEQLGAEVDLTRGSNSPVNPHKVSDYFPYALSKLGEKENIALPQNKVKIAKALCEKTFYRAGEIKARASLVNDDLKPDLVVCIHFNASDWNKKDLEPAEHCHMILNGAYTYGELAKDNDRFTLVTKILQRVHNEEAALSASVARAFTYHTGLPPYAYDPNSSRAVNVNKDPYLWARNLAANRQFMCPVVYCEPYLMNGVDSHQRILLGDYEGLRFVNGMLRPSIFREYVNSVTEGLVNYYSKRDKEDGK